MASKDLYVRKGVLEENTAENEKRRMMARIEEEEAKLQERRAKQEQQLAYRANKRAQLQNAKDAEKKMEDALIHLLTAEKDRQELKPLIERTKIRLSELEKQQEAAIATLHKAQHRVAHLSATCDATKQKLHDLENEVDVSIIEQRRDRLSVAYSDAEAAWDVVQKAVRKKERNRDLKKVVKDTLR